MTDNHLDKLTDEQIEDLYDGLVNTFSGRTHHRLLVIAREPTTSIFISDHQGNLVARSVGRFDEQLEKGHYNVQFGTGNGFAPFGPKRKIRLWSGTQIDE